MRRVLQSGPPVRVAKQDDATPTAPARRRTRRAVIFRWVLRAAVALVLVGALAIYVLSRSPLVARTVRSQVRTLTGAEITADDMRVLPNGSLVMRGVVVRAPGIGGAAGELVRVERAVLELDWSGLVGGRGVRPTALRMHGPTFRFSQSVDDQSLNFGALRAGAGVMSGGGGARGGLVGGTMLPRIDVIDGLVEFREHSAQTGRDDLLNSMQVAGAIIPMEQVAAAGAGAASRTGSGGAGSVYLIRLQEIGRRAAVAGAADSARGMLLDGRADLSTGESSLRLLNVSLNTWPPEAVASAMRPVWSRLNLRGAIRQATLEYAPESGVRAVIEPSEVSMTVLIPREPLDGRGGDADRAPRGTAGERGLLPLERVNGRIELSRAGVRAELDGVVDGSIPATVTLTTEGLSLDAALRCEISAKRLNIEKNPEFLPYMPEQVRFYFRAFSGPTAEADARIVIQRARAGTDGAEGAITVPQGQISMVNGTAAFHTFPYRFEKLRGRAEFSDTHLHIIEITGENPNGARMRGRAMVTPLTEDAEAQVEVRVEGVPWDDELLEAVGEPRNNVLESVLWMPAYEELKERGLVAGGAGEAGGPPVFEPGGRATIDVRVLRPRGADVDWSTTVDVRLDRVGLVPRNFPYPIIASGVALRVTDDRAELLSGVFRGLRGGAAEMTATVSFPEDKRREPVPSIEIDASGVPVDDLLIHAIPGEPLPEGEDGAGLSAREVLRRLRVLGTVDCRLAVGPQDGHNGDELGYDVAVALRDVSAWPMLDGAPEAGPATALAAITGEIGVTRERIRVAGLRGTVVSRSGVHELGGVAPADRRCGTIAVDLDAPTSNEAPAGEPRQGLTVRVRADDLDTSASIERLVAVFAPAAAAEIERLRAAHAPTGVVGANVLIDQAPMHGVGGEVREGTISAVVRVDRLTDFSITALGGRVSTPGIDGVGAFEVRVLPSVGVAFDRTSADVLYNGEPSGRVTLEGGLTIAGDRPAGTLAEPSVLRVSVMDARLESGAVRRLAGLTESFMDGAAIAGSFDGEARVKVVEQGAVRVEGAVRPRSMAIESGGRRLSFTGVEGQVRFESTGGDVRGSIEGVRTNTADDRGVRGRIDGAWQYAAQQGDLRLDARLNARAGVLTDELRAWLPEEVRSALDEMSMSVEGPVEVSDARLRVIAQTRNTGQTRTRFDGPVRFEGVGLDIGVPVRGASGVLDIGAGLVGIGGEAAAGEVAAEGGALELRLREGAMTIAGVPVSGVEAGARRTPADQAGTQRIDLVSAHGDVLGGRCWANGWVAPGSADGPTRYGVEVLLAGVPVAPLLERLVTGEDAVLDRAAVAERGVAGAAAARGVLDAALALSGQAGAPETRIGRGSARIADGDVLRLPVIFPMLQMSNLMLPSDDRLDYLQSTFHIEGVRARFDELTVLSRTLALVGTGTVSLPEFGLDLRFNTRSNQRIPVLSSVFEALRDEIVTTRVRGTVNAPAVSTETLPMTRRIFGQLFPNRDGRGTTGAGALGPGREGRAQRERARIEGSAAPHPPAPVEATARGGSGP